MNTAVIVNMRYKKQLEREKERGKEKREENEGDQGGKRENESGGGGQWRLCHTLTVLQACCSSISALIHELSFPNCPRLLAFSSFGCHLDSKESFG